MDAPGGNQDIIEALAALPGAEVLLYSADGAIPQFVVGELGKIDLSQEADLVAGDSALRAALPPILKAFRLSNQDLVLRKISTDETGARHFRYDQKLHGLDVIGGDLVVHVDVNGAIFGINGTTCGGGAPAPGAIAISEDAANLAIASDARWAGLAGRAVTGPRMVYLLTEAGALHKAYEQVIEGVRDADPVRDKVYVDVERGDVLAVHPTIHFVKNRMIYSANNTTTLPGTLKRSEGGAATGDLDVDGAYDGTGAAYQMYANFFGRDSYNNAGAQLTSTVHYSTNYCNAFWNGSQMAYGDGNASQNCLPLARAVDVTGHELTHAVTRNESDLIYSGESGGLNESLSDIFGNVTEAWVDGGSTGTILTVSDNTFLVGEEVRAPYFRSMCDPAADNSSADIWSSSLGGIDVHYSSGPNNLVFCLLSKGGTHPRNKTTNNVPAIGIEKAVRIFYLANIALLTSNSNYAAMRTAAIQAAQILGYDQATQDAVACAYAAIAVGTVPESCDGPPGGVLTNNVPVTGLSDSTVGNFKYWSLEVPEGQTTLTFTISGGLGDADMYVGYGSKPTTAAFQCRPFLVGNYETCTFTAPSAGTYWVGLRAYRAYSGVTLTGMYSLDHPGDPYLTNGVPVSNLTGATGSTRYYRINVPSGKTLTINISGGVGDADLYTRFGARPTTTTFTCRPYLSGNKETCTHTTTSTTAGAWYIMVYGYMSYSGVQLIGSY